MRPESAGRSRPQSAGVNPDRLPLPPRLEAPAERVEYNGSSQRVEYTGSSMAGPVDVLRQSRGRPTSARSNRESVCSELSSANSVAALPRASKRLGEARDEVQWLDTKFRRSGHSHPGEGEMTVVIEYCYNSSTRQMSTTHNEQRYHEEAELVRQYVLHYCPEACVFVVPIDFSTATSFHRGGEARLGAFEIDARIRVDGEMLTYSLWSKLNSKLWPVWPDWQDALRQLLPVFELWIRPCAEHDDGTADGQPTKYVTGVSVSVLNFRGDSLQSGVITATQAGLRVRLMRGTYTVRVTASGTDVELGRQYLLPEEAKLELARVPAPTGDGPVELNVYLSAQARQANKIDLKGLPTVVPGEAPENVMVKVTDPRTGQTIFRGTAAELSAKGEVDIDDKKRQGRGRAGAPLCEQLMPRREGKEGKPSSARASQPLSPGRASGYPSPGHRLPSQRAPGHGVPSAAWDDRDGPDEGAAEVRAEGAQGRELKVELSLPNDPTARLAPATVRLTEGGALPAELSLKRSMRPIVISIATPEAWTDRWCRTLPLPRLHVVVREEALSEVGRRRDDGVVVGLDGKVVGAMCPDGTIVGHASGTIRAHGTVVGRDVGRASGSGYVQPAPEPEGSAAPVSLHPDALYTNATVRPDGMVEAHRLHRGDALVPARARQGQQQRQQQGQGQGQGYGQGQGQQVSAELRLPGGLKVDETYHFEVQPTAETLGAAETLTVCAGDGPLEVSLMPERTSSRLRIGWAAARVGREHWSDGLVLPEGFVFNLYHQASTQRVNSRVSSE